MTRSQVQQAAWATNNLQGRLLIWKTLHVQAVPYDYYECLQLIQTKIARLNSPNLPNFVYLSSAFL